MIRELIPGADIAIGSGEYKSGAGPAGRPEGRARLQPSAGKFWLSTAIHASRRPCGRYRSPAQTLKVAMADEADVYGRFDVIVDGATGQAAASPASAGVICDISH